jgi:hypothetical protein
MGTRTQAALTVSASIAVILGGTVALARDQARGERVNGDDDPIIVSRSVSLPELANVHFLDPETMGSVLRGEARTRRQTCDQIAFFPDRPAERQFEDWC